MTTHTLTSFENELGATWRLFRAQWKTAVKIALVPVVPFLFVLPYAFERTALFLGPQSNAPVSLLSTLAAVLGLLAFFIATFITKAALYTAMARSPAVGARRALKQGARRLLHVLWTDILMAILMTAALLPSLFIYSWYAFSQRGLISDPSILVVSDALFLTITIILILPAFAVAVALLFAPVVAALGESPGGIPSLLQSIALVRGRGRPVLWRIAGWTLLSAAVSFIVSPLPIAWWLVPFLLALCGAAFLIVLYKELRER